MMTQSVDLEVVRNSLSGMSRPAPLAAALAFHSSQSDPPVSFAEAELYARLREADQQDLLAEEVLRRLQQWDFVSNGDWITGTDSNTTERRERIYELLQISPSLRELFDERFPAYRPAEPLVVIKADEHEPWYDGGAAALTRFYWPAYEKYLREVLRWPEHSIQELDSSTTEIMERLSAPWRTEQFQSKGLVVGYVQSGKTANFTGVLAKGADAGYRLFIVLAGTLNILRRQTQRRIDKELIGRELLEADYQDDAELDQFISHGARPSELGAFDFRSLTGPEDDYRALKRGIESLDFPRADASLPFFDRANLRPAPARIMVIKKNTTRLKSLAKDLERIRTKLGQIPTLVIDDESDQASLNTLKPTPARDRTATNRAITNLLQQLPRAQYVGYTATPFANVFVDPRDAEDLFPKDFIVALPRPDPDDYMGSSDFHDFTGAEVPGYASNERSFVRGVVGADNEPENLRKALDSFILSGAIKLYRDSKGYQYRARYKHHTMLVHQSHRVARHSDLALLTNQLFDSGGYYAGEGDTRLSELWLKDFQPVSAARCDADTPQPKSFAELRPFVSKCLQKVENGTSRVLVVNGENNETPDFDRGEVWKILVGGTKLSRGYTIEGLTISYYRRPAKASDTLMQMGRWFGYRKGYRDLVRLFVGRREGREQLDLYTTFGAVCQDEMDFRAELVRYARPQNGSKAITPLQIPPLVAARTLQPTAKNKMWNAEIVAQNFGGNSINSTLAPTNAEDVLSNLQLADRLIAKIDLTRLTLGASSGGGKPNQFDALCGSVSSQDMVQFLKDYRWLEESEGTRRKVLQRQIEFLEGAYGDPEIDGWLLIAPQRRNAKDTLTMNGMTFTIKERSRTVANDRYSRYEVYTEPEHVRVAEYASGINPHNPSSDSTSSLQKGRQAVCLFYPVRDPHKDPPRVGRSRKQYASIGFALYCPRNHIASPITFRVRNPDRAGDVVVDAPRS